MHGVRIEFLRHSILLLHYEAVVLIRWLCIVVQLHANNEHTHHILQELSCTCGKPTVNLRRLPYASGWHTSPSKGETTSSPLLPCQHSLPPLNLHSFPFAHLQCFEPNNILPDPGLVSLDRSCRQAAWSVLRCKVIRWPPGSVSNTQSAGRSAIIIIIIIMAIIIIIIIIILVIILKKWRCEFDCPAFTLSRGKCRNGADEQMQNLPARSLFTCSLVQHDLTCSLAHLCI